MQAGGLGAVLDAAGVFFAPVCDDLGFSRSELSLYLTFYFIATIFAMPLVGRWITRFNINKLLTTAFFLVVVFVAAMGFYDRSWQWWVSGIVFGLAGSFIFVVPAPILIDNWFHRRKGLALGVAMSFSSIGGAILAPAFTILIQSFGWRTAYLIAACIMALLVLPWTAFVFKLHPEDVGETPYGYDGTLEEDKGERILSGVPLKSAVKSVSFVCMFLFAGLIAYFAGFNSQLPGYAQSIGYSPLVSSSLLTAVMVGSVIEKYLIGWLNDRVGVVVTVNIQLAMVLIGFIGFVFAGQSLPALYVSAFFFGAQNSLVSISTPLLIRQLFGERDFPAIFANARIGTGVIGCLGPVTIAGIFDSTGSFAAAFWVGIAVVALGFASVRVAYGFRGKLHWIADEGSVGRNDREDIGLMC